MDYSKSKIYKIESMCGSKCYIGSTTKKFLSQRMSAHRENYRRWKSGKQSKFTAVFDIFDEFGVDNCRIYLIELCVCDSKDELRRRVGHQIKTLECVNKIISGQTKTEYNESHKEETALKAKNYNESHKEEKAINNKKYRDTHKEKLKEYTAKYNEENKEKIALKNKEYKETHKEELKIKRKLRDEAKKAEKATQLI